MEINNKKCVGWECDSLGREMGSGLDFQAATGAKQRGSREKSEVEGQEHPKSQPFPGSWVQVAWIWEVRVSVVGFPKHTLKQGLGRKHLVEEALRRSSAVRLQRLKPSESVLMGAVGVKGQPPGGPSELPPHQCIHRNIHCPCWSYAWELFRGDLKGALKGYGRTNVVCSTWLLL